MGAIPRSIGDIVEGKLVLPAQKGGYGPSDDYLRYINCGSNLTIPAFHIKNEWNINPKVAAVLYFHANGVNLSGCKVECELLSLQLRADVIAFEYPGYGLAADRVLVFSFCARGLVLASQRLMR